MTKTHKDSDGAMICDTCGTPVVWMQSKAGKWMLVNAKKVAIDTSSRYEHSSRMDVVATTQIPHYRFCENFALMEQRKHA